MQLSAYRAVGMEPASIWKPLQTRLRAYRPELRFCIRVTAAALTALLIAQLFSLPLHGLWVVLTATVVTQLSIGGSIRAGLEYFLGTLGGAAYAGIVGFLFPHSTLLAQSGVLIITVAPLGFLAALNPTFRVAPFSAILVLLISGQLGEGSIESALIRLLEVTLGGAVAVITSFVVFPERAHRLACEAGARVLEEMARDAVEIFSGFLRRVDRTQVNALQDRIGQTVSELQRVVEEVERERPVNFRVAPDPAPLPRTLLRIRHDFVMIGRASSEPFPTHLCDELEPALDGVTAGIAAYFRDCAVALRSQRPPPSPRLLQEEFDAFASQIAASRQRDIAELSANQLEQLFALGFVLEQLQRNIKDLERCIQEWVSSPRDHAKKSVT